MPIFMDRHNVNDDITAETIARLHKEDLKVQSQFACNCITYWWDEQKRSGFCLIEAPDAQSIHQLHSHAHGAVPNKVIEVDPNLVEAFLGRIEDHRKPDNTELNIIDDPAFRIIMAIRPIMASQKINPAIPGFALKQYKKDVLNLLNAYDGSLVKEEDGYFLISFRLASQAVHSALDIYSFFREIEEKNNREKISLKIGLSAGLPVTDKESIFEEAIRLAERMCMIVNGKIILSAEVRDLYHAESEDPLQEKEIYILSPTDERFLNGLMDHTEANWTNADLNVNDFCKPIGYSKSQLYRKIMALTGNSLNSFIKEYRLDKALSLLSKHECNVSEIAYETGFSSPSYFTKCFQKRFEKSPTDWMASLSA